MGTDITMVIERRVPGGWEMLPIPEASCYLCRRGDRRPSTLTEDGVCSRCEGTGRFRPNGHWVDRDYDLFCILGLYGDDEENNKRGLHLIAELRGIPEDASAEARAVMATEDHSHGWLYARELLERDWQGFHEWRGFVGDMSWSEWLLRLGGCGPPDDVRVLFGFDS